jgi:hypothetical protein
MELNVRIAIPQLVDNKQVYEEIPPVSVLSIASNQNENFYTLCFCKMSHFRKRFVKQITHTNEIDSNI